MTVFDKTYTFNKTIHEFLQDILQLLGGGPYDGETLRTAKDALNEFLIELGNKGVPWDWVEDVTIPLVAGQNTYLLGDKYLDVLTLRTLDNANDRELPINRMTQLEYDNLVDKTRQGSRPVQFTTTKHEDGIRIKIWPSPSSATAYSLIAKCNLMAPDVSNYAEYIRIPKRFLPMIKYGVAFNMALTKPTVDAGKLEIIKAKYEELYADVMTEDADRGPFIIRPYYA